MTLPRIVVTSGEPAGIGPEVAVAAWRALGASIPMVWIGDPRHLPNGTPITELSDLSALPDAPAHAMPVLSRRFKGAATPGQPDQANAAGVIDVIAEAVDLVQSGAASALCTAPIHKKALKDGADFPYPGHTEYLAALAGGHQRAVMMLASD